MAEAEGGSGDQLLRPDDWNRHLAGDTPKRIKARGVRGGASVIGPLLRAGVQLGRMIRYPEPGERSNGNQPCLRSRYNRTSDTSVPLPLVDFPQPHRPAGPKQPVP